MDAVLARTRLFKRMDGLRARRLVWIEAPGGAGKTTLAATWIAARRRSVVWLHIDEGDDDPATFYYFLALGARLLRSRRRIILPTLTPEHRLALELFARNFARRFYACLPNDAIVVLDNYQDLPAGSAMHGLVSLLAAEAPDGYQVIVMSRQHPPSAFARLEANREMERVTWDELRLSGEDALAIAALHRRQSVSASEIQHLLDIADGWTAGFVLLLQALESRLIRPPSVDTAGDLPAERERLFAYFAREVFDQAPASTREFLLRSAAIDTMPAAVVAAATGNKHAGADLHELVRRGYFTTELDGIKATYRYHPLFLAFLRERAEQAFGPAAWNEVRMRALSALMDAEEFEAAAELAAQIRAWPALERAIGAIGQALIENGRNVRVIQWTAAMTEPDREQHAWLRFWRAAALMPVDPDLAIAETGRVWEQFDKLDDAAGLYLAFAQLADGLLILRGFRQLASWLPKLEALRRRIPVAPSPAIEARLVGAAYQAYAFWNPAHPSMAAWERLALAIVADASAPALARMGIGSTLMLRATWFGSGRERAIWAKALLDPMVAQEHTPPVARIAWAVFLTTFHFWYDGAEGRARSFALSDEAFALAQEHGIPMFDALLHASCSYMLLAEGDTARAIEHGEKALRLALQMSSYEDSHRAYILLGAWRATGDLARALAHADRCFETGHQSGAPSAITYSLIGRALVHQAAGRRVAALRDAAAGRRMAVHYRFTDAAAMARLVGALVALDRGDERRAAPLLRAGLGIAARDGFRRFPAFSREDFSRLCAAGLRFGIEQNYVSTLVRERALPAPPEAGEEWPWPVRLRCLGSFALEVGGVPVEFARKAPKKPIEVLKALAALGGDRAPVTTITDALWPDLDGDAAHHALTMAVHRLKRLIGESVIVMRSDELFLDKGRVGVDIHAFEQHSAAPATATDAGLYLAIACYRGALLPADGAGWTDAPRERLRNRYRRVVVERARRLETAGASPAALELATRAIEIDEQAEEFHQIAIACCRRMGRDADALAAYRRCERALAAGLGAVPSAATRRLVADLLPGA